MNMTHIIAGLIFLVIVLIVAIVFVIRELSVLSKKLEHQEYINSYKPNGKSIAIILNLEKQLSDCKENVAQLEITCRNWEQAYELLQEKILKQTR